VCGQVVASKFLFDERLFDTEYFRTKMAESRENARIRREEIKNLLAASRSQPLIFENSQELDSVPGLVMALDEFIGSTEIHHVSDYAPPVEFRIEEYREAILTALADYSLRFTAFSPLSGDLRKDRIWRFITLIHLEHNGEVELIQEGNDILVRRHEADREGQAVY
jgi:chromatin segregation and condensation protein Rec8/ScpA/Scc1 (kleisin family)